MSYCIDDVKATTRLLQCEQFEHVILGILYGLSYENSGPAS